MNKMFNRKVLLVLAAILSIALFAAGCGSKDTKKAEEKLKFPTKPITLINPFSAGGSADTTARVLAKYAKKYVGQTVVVENRPGGGGTIGQAAGAKAAPDGYTLTLLTPSAVYGSVLNPNLQFTYKSFAPIVLLVNDADYLVVRNVEPFNKIESFIAHAKANPGKVKIGNSGAGTSDALASVEMEQLIGAKVTHIPFDGNSMSLPALLGGHVDAILVNYSDIESKLKSGDLKLIAIFANERSKVMPDVPTGKEKGINLLSGSYRGIVAPAGTDPKVVKFLHDAFKKTIDDPEYQAQMKKVGLPSSYLGSEDFAKLMETNYQRFKNFKK